jgi:hypothetical protein
MGMGVPVGIMAGYEASVLQPFGQSRLTGSTIRAASTSLALVIPAVSMSPGGVLPPLGLLLPLVLPLATEPLVTVESAPLEAPLPGGKLDSPLTAVAPLLGATLPEAPPAEAPPSGRLVIPEPFALPLDVPLDVPLLSEGVLAGEPEHALMRETAASHVTV